MSGTKFFKQISLKLPADADSVLRNIADVMKRQIKARCPAQVTMSDSHPLGIDLAVDASLEPEAFQIGNGHANSILIRGGSARGALYGVGKFLRDARYGEDGFAPGDWRGTSAPECSFRAVYFATHFQNFYEAAPIEEVVNYVRELGLWGYNALVVHFPTWQFDGIDDPSARTWLERCVRLFKEARQCGMRTGLVQAPNQGYKQTPKELLGREVAGNFRGNNFVNLCAGSEEKRAHLLALYDGLCDALAGVDLDYFIFWPYDEGGCACEQCHPWGGRGFLEISRRMAGHVRIRFPDCRVVLSTWCFENEDDRNPDGEWAGLETSLQKDKAWVDYLMADGHDNYFPGYILKHGVPGGLPLVNFPEISMFGMHPWGGYGANPAPAHFQFLWDRIKETASGGMPYSEGIFEDINKAIVAGFYWDRHRDAMEIVWEYAAFEFGREVAGEITEVIKILEENHDRAKIQPSARRAFEMVVAVEKRLSQRTRSGWRWRLVYLRALIDKELFEHNGQPQGSKLKAAFDELVQLSYAQNVFEALRPPTVIST